MLSIEEYKRDPCKSLSLPYWKAQNISIPSNMKIVHDAAWEPAMLNHYTEERFFRIIHCLKNIPAYSVPGVRLETLSPARTEELADMINRSYTHSNIHISAEQLQSMTQTPVYCPALWIGAFFGEMLAGSILCDYDAHTGEAVIEWLQVLPAYRGKGIAAALICEALKRMRGMAEFATVSGACANPTNPEKVYRKCGFEGDNIWHILTERP